MAISRYWRLVGICTSGNGPLELSEVRLYEAGVLADASATLTSTVAPTSGSLADLRDGVATGVVSWAYADYSQPGFALVWDFSAGAGLEFAQLRLGSGTSYASFPAELTAQSSADGINWTSMSSVSNAVFPGVQALSPVPSAAADSNLSAVSLLLHGSGPNGSKSIVDSSPAPKTVTPYGNTQISTLQSKFSGSSLFFDGNGSYLSVPPSGDLSLISGDSTIEAWVFPTALTSGSMVLFSKDGVSGVSYAQYALAINPSGVLVAFLGNGNGTNPSGTAYAGVTPIQLNVWHHVALVIYGTLCLGFLDGVQQWSAAAAQRFEGGKPLLIGYDAGQPAEAFFRGYMGELRITKGAARYTGNFAVPTVAFSSPTLMQTGASIARTRKVVSGPERLLPSIDLPDTAAVGHLREQPFFDVYNGGIGMIYGTVKEKNTPANTPLHRRVLLIDEASRMTIRETWSDARTGNYEFRGVKEGVTYTVTSYDHTGAYRAVVADHQIPELIP